MVNEKRFKNSRACDYCQKRKVKCVGLPPCQMCARKSIDCSFNTIDKRSIPRTNGKKSKGQLSKVINYRFAKVNTLDVMTDLGHRFHGEFSINSFIKDCKDILNFKVETKSSDKSKNEEILQIALPNKELIYSITSLYLSHSSLYTIEIENFNTLVIEPICTNYSECKTNQIVLINLVISIGIYLAEIEKNPMVTQLQPMMKSSTYFDFGLDLTKKNLTLGEFWITEACLLISIYYFLNDSPDEAWLILGYAIRNLQGITMDKSRGRTHREKICKSLYILDQLFSTIMGRPSMVTCELLQDCVYSDLTKVEVQIIHSIYEPKRLDLIALNNVIHSLIKQAVTLQYQSGMVQSDISSTTLMVKVLHLYYILLSFRPFLLHLISNKQEILKHFKSSFQISLKSIMEISILASLLIIHISQKRVTGNKRVEDFLFINACITAALTIALSIECHETYPIEILKGIKCLNDTFGILKSYSKWNSSAYQYQHIVNQIMGKFIQKHNINIYQIENHEEFLNIDLTYNKMINLLNKIGSEMNK